MLDSGFGLRKTVPWHSFVVQCTFCKPIRTVELKRSSEESCVCLDALKRPEKGQSAYCVIPTPTSTACTEVGSTALLHPLLAACTPMRGAVMIGASAGLCSMRSAAREDSIDSGGPWGRGSAPAVAGTQSVNCNVHARAECKCNVAACKVSTGALHSPATCEPSACPRRVG